MRLDHCTWFEVDAYLTRCRGIIIPVGSTEQHGPLGLIGTDSHVARAAAERVGDITGALVAPALTVTPAPFNLSFPGTISINAELFSCMLKEIVTGLAGQGFRRFYFLNAHGANLESLTALRCDDPGTRVMTRSWWDFSPVQTMRDDLYGDWEGVHATPSEIAITQIDHRRIAVSEESREPPARLDRATLTSLAGDRHGPPDGHRRRYPDGRVGSHSALARPEHGRQLLDLVVRCVVEDYNQFVSDDSIADQAE